MSSWTKEIRYWINFLSKILKSELYNYQFVDIGCGKGKPIFIYSEMMKNILKNVEYPPLGIDYSQNNIKIADSNSLKLGLCDNLKPVFINDDAVNTVNYVRSKNLLLYLYNPFTGNTFKQFIKSLALYDCWLIYNNPTELSFLEKNNWLLKSYKKGGHPNTTSALFFKESNDY